MIPRFCIQDNITGKACTPCSVSRLKEVMASEKVQNICDQIKLLDGNDPDEMARLKKQLPVITPHAQRFENDERKNQYAIPSGLAMLDVDDVDHPAQLFNRLSPNDIADHHILFAAITPSGHGLRLIAERQEGESVANASLRLASVLQVSQYDAVTKDLARASFVMPASYVLYMDETRLEFPDEATAQTVAEAFCESENSPLTFEPSNSAAVELSKSCASANECLHLQFAEAKTGGVAAGNGELSNFQTFEPSNSAAAAYPMEYRGVPYSQIVENLVNILGGAAEQGERNNTLYAVALNLRYICNFDPNFVLHYLPNYGLSQREMTSIAKNACSSSRRNRTPDLMERAIAMAQNNMESANTNTREFDAATLAMPKLPKVLDTICRRLPESFRPAMVIAALPVLGALATRIRMEYFDHQIHSFSFMSMITAPAATGKSFIRRPVNMLLTPIDEQDAIEREKQQEYEEKKKANKNNKMQPTDPHAAPRHNGVCISIAKLLQLLSYSGGKHLIAVGEEIDTLVKSEKAGVWSQKTDIYRNAFDNAEYGQNYMSENSFSSNEKIYYNLLMTGTPKGMYRFFKDVEDGLVTRWCFAQLPDMFGADMPHFENYTKREEKEIIDTARKLDRMDGHIFCPKVDEAILDWLNHYLNIANATQSHAIDTLRRRAAVIGWRAGYLAALLNGSALYNKSQPRTANYKQNAQLAVDFALYVANYTLFTQMALFGDKFENEALSQEQSVSRKGSVRGLLGMLPNTFSRKELIAIRISNGQGSDVRNVLSRWCQNGFTVDNGDQTYTKTSKALAI